jgi:hypothetical protein
MKAETVPTQDDSRPNYEPSFRGSFMRNFCRECGQYKWVCCAIDLGDGKGPGYVCGRCRSESMQRQTSAGDPRRI